MVVFACLPELYIVVQLLVLQLLLDGVVVCSFSRLHCRKEICRGGKMDLGNGFGEERRRMKKKLGVWALLCKIGKQGS